MSMNLHHYIRFSANEKNSPLIAHIDEYFINNSR